MKNEVQAAAAKQEYQAPQLSELGNLTDLTLNGTAPSVDGGLHSL